MSLKMLAVAVLALLAPSVHAQAVDLASRPFLGTSQLWIEGGSNVKDWSCRAAAVVGRATLDTAMRATDAGRAAGDAITGVALRVVVRDFKCGNGHMERDLYRALRADDPTTGGEIRASLSVVECTTSGVRRSSMETSGTVTVAGVVKPVRSTITVVQLDDGTLRAFGTLSARMTDFGVTPPTGLLGLVRSRNEITVRFDLLISDHAVAPTEPRPR